LHELNNLGQTKGEKMKQLLFLLLIAPVITFANTDNNFDTGNYFKADRITISPLCPEGVQCITDGTIIDLEYIVPCHQKMTGFEHKVFNGPNGELDIVVAAYKEFKVFEMHEVVCQGMELVKKQITLVNEYLIDPDQVSQLGSYAYRGLTLEEIRFTYKMLAPIGF